MPFTWIGGQFQEPIGSKAQFSQIYFMYGQKEYQETESTIMERGQGLGGIKNKRTYSPIVQKLGRTRFSPLSLDRTNVVGLLAGLQQKNPHLCLPKTIPSLFLQTLRFGRSLSSRYRPKSQSLFPILYCVQSSGCREN